MTRKSILWLLLIALLPFLSWAQPFKHKYYDPQVNVNDLIAEADAWFLENGTGPGKGWKTYQRWRYEMERRFYPSGDRSTWDPQAAARAYEAFKATQATQKSAGTVGHWTFRGPSDVSSILPPSWAAGLGRIEAVWGGYATSDTVYLGSRSGGFWKTTDGGAHWRNTTKWLPAMGVVDIEVRPGHPEEVWIVTRHAAGYTYGLLRSTDFGETWNTTSLSYGQQQAYAGELVVASADTFFLSTNGGIQRSVNGGNTWASCYSGNMVTILGHSTNSQILYAFDSNSYSQIRRSTNGGTTWQSFPVTGNNGYPFLAASPALPDGLWLGSSAGIFRSTDQGMTWNNISPDPTNSGVMTLGVSGTQPQHIYAGSLNQYKSTDGGSTWSVFADWVNYNSTNYLHADMRVFRTWGNRIFSGTDGFLGFSSDNGSTWTRINQGTGVKEFYRIGCSAMNAEHVVGGSQDNGTSVMLDGVWHEWIGADGMQAHFDYNNPDIWFGTIQNGNLQRTNQAGQNAQGIAPSTNGPWITPSVIDPNNENTLFIAYDSVYKSVDNGDTWQRLSGFSSGSYDEMAISPSDSNVLYITRVGAVRRSDDNGRTWVSLNNGLPPGFVNRVAVHPDDPMQVAVCYSGFNASNKVYFSNNGGTSWSNITGNLPNLPANALAWAEGPTAQLFLGMDVGVYYAPAAANTWTLYADSLPALVVNDLEILNGAGLVRAGTWGGGVWEAPLPDRVGKPQIVHVRMDPVSDGLRPRPADTVRIHAVVRNAGGIQAAVLRWGLSTTAQPNVVPMQLVQGDTFVAAIPPHATGTRIYYRIVGTTPNGDSARTERLMYRVKAAIPCSATGSAGTSFDFIDTVAVAGMTHASGQDHYGDFRSTFATVIRDSSYTLMSSLNYSFALDSMFLWVDWNHDGDFAGEQVIMSDIDANHNSYGAFTVPHILNVPDTVLLRVRCIYGNNVVADPCNSYFGEVEDYSLEVRGPLVAVDGPLALDVVVAPNPAQDIVRVLWPSGRYTHVDAALLDLWGRRLAVPVTVDAGGLRLHVAALSAGVYLVEVVADGALRHVRLQVARN